MDRPADTTTKPIDTIAVTAAAQECLRPILQQHEPQEWIFTMSRDQ
jgi:hypothetical protein